MNSGGSSKYSHHSRSRSPRYRSEHKSLRRRSRSPQQSNSRQRYHRSWGCSDVFTLLFMIWFLDFVIEWMGWEWGEEKNKTHSYEWRRSFWHFCIWHWRIVCNLIWRLLQERNLAWSCNQEQNLAWSCNQERNLAWSCNQERNLAWSCNQERNLAWGCNQEQNLAWGCDQERNLAWSCNQEQNFNNNNNTQLVMRHMSVNAYGYIWENWIAGVDRRAVSDGRYYCTSKV